MEDEIQNQMATGLTFCWSAGHGGIQMKVEDVILRIIHIILLKDL